jgi:uncharacterized protein DUF6789
MDPATERHPAYALSAFLAGLQAGMLGVLWMLAWLGISAAWQQRSFWTAENLMASGFFGAGSIHSGFATQTLSGLALYLALYSLLGGLFALVLRDRLPRLRTLLVAIAFAIAWYYLSFHLIWKSIMPLVALLHVQRYTVLGHLIYGTILGRYPLYLAGPAGPSDTESAVSESEPGAAV